MSKEREKQEPTGRDVGVKIHQGTSCEMKEVCLGIWSSVNGKTKIKPLAAPFISTISIFAYYLLCLWS